MRLFGILLTFFTLVSYGQAPPGYYQSAEGLSGQDLRHALQLIIDDHQEQTYASIWTHFLSTDAKESGYVWDMYSDVPGGNPAYTFTFVTDQCGNYGAEGDCYNREHSFPKSWFNDAAPMLTDLFQIYPTDGYVNGKRSNFPYGEVASPIWTSTNGSRLGNCSYPGYSGEVFEPIDEYKGDFARTYFYMMTRYMDLVPGWSSDMLNGGDLASWARNLLLDWDEQDPVSQKETDRNNAIFLIQNNRNPFIDHPEYQGLIWGNSAGIGEKGTFDIKVWTSGQTLFADWNNNIIHHVTLTNLLGQQVYSFNVDQTRFNKELNLIEGLYVVSIFGKADFIVCKIFISNLLY